MTESIEPEQAVEMYLNERESEVAFETHRNHKYHLRRFLEWCEAADFDDMSRMSGKKIYEYKQYRRNVGDVNDMTLKNQLSTFRVFLRFCEDLDFVEDGLVDKVRMPTIDVRDQKREEFLNHDEAEAILEYLERMERATLRHSVFYLMWHCGLRLGSVRALDLGDYHSDKQYIELRHRPESDTPLKNGEAGERQVYLERSVCDILDDYITYKRKKVTDDYGRKPLFTAPTGRIYGSVIREQIYALTRPCHYTGTCPHGREQSDCEATKYDEASQCPSSLSPHPIRRGAITAHLNKDIPKQIISGRADVSVEVLEKHYDARSESEKRELREEYLDDI